jgi:aminodeoxyfutalosine deaminase
LSIINVIYRQLPKAELHLHLEGSVEPETMQMLAPDFTEAQIRSLYQCADFAGFIECYTWVTRHLRQPSDYALITRHLLKRLAEQNVWYAEITLSAGVVLWKNQDLEAVYQAVRHASAGAPLTVYWILDAIRHFGAGHAMQVAEMAAGWVNDGVIGFGIGGDEQRGPAEWFADVYRFARSQGLHLTAHAGETMGPESVWKALQIGAERIGHGIAAALDPALMRHLRDHNIPLEICITSNVITRAVKSLKEHPVRRLYDAGVPIVLNTDDPGIFGTTLSKEYELAAREFGFTKSELEAIALNGFRYAFQEGIDFQTGESGSNER